MGLQDVRTRSPNHPFSLVRGCVGQVGIPKIVVERSASDTFLLATLPVRNLLRTWRMQPLNLAFRKQAWNKAAFSELAKQSFEHVDAARVEENFEALREHVADQLLEELRSEARMFSGNCTLVEVQPLGISTSRLWPDEKRHLSLWV